MVLIHTEFSFSLLPQIYSMLDQCIMASLILLPAAEGGFLLVERIVTRLVPHNVSYQSGE